MTRVITSLDPGWEAEFVAKLGALRTVTVSRRCADLADLLSAAAAGLGEVAFVSSTRGMDRSVVDQLTGHGLRVVGVTNGDEASEVSLRRLGMVHIVSRESAGQDLEAAIDQEDDSAWAAALGLPTEPAQSPAATPAAVAPEPAPAPPSAPAQGRIVAVWGPTGAPGRTVVAVNLAAELAAAGLKSLIVDADTYGASVGQMLSVVDEAPGMAAAARASEQGALDLPTLSRLAPEVVPGMRVLTGLPSAARWPELRAGAVEQILDLARSLADVVVVDCGFSIESDEELTYDSMAPQRNAATLSSLAAADEVLLVGVADPVGLQRLVRASQEIGTIASAAPRVIVNRVRTSTVGPDPTSRIAEALSRFAGLDDLSFIPDDPAALDAAMMVGRTLDEVTPESPARIAIRQLATTFLPEELVAPTRVRPDRGSRSWALPRAKTPASE